MLESRPDLTHPVTQGMCSVGLAGTISLSNVASRGRSGSGKLEESGTVTSSLS